MEQQNFLQEFLKTSEKELTPKQAKIIEAAIEIFSEKGFAAASTSEIAKRAGVAEGTIFRHYKTKKDLLISIVMPVIVEFAVPFMAEKFLNEVFHEDNLKDFDKFIRQVIYNRYEFVKNNAQIIKILLQEVPYQTELKEGFSKVFTSKVMPRFQAAVEHLQKKGDIVDYPVATIFRLTVSTIMGFLISRFIIFPDFNWDDEKEMEYTIEFIKKGLAKN
jgi:AcrR family transcriptional regulator